MPPGKVHDRLWYNGLKIVVWFGYPLLIIISFSIKSIDPLAFVIGYLMGSVIEPDLDQLALTTSEGRLLRWFKDFGALFIGYFTWYAYRFPHRGISHFPIIGTLTRWLWIFTPIMIIWLASGNFENFIFFTHGWFWWAFAGNCFSDFIHIGADKSWKIIKKLYRKR